MNRFISDGEDIIKGTILGTRPDSPISACPRTGPGTWTLYVVNPDWELAISGHDAGGPADPGGRESHHMALICDASSSTRTETCNHVEIKHAYKLFIIQALRSGKGSFTVWRVGDSRRNTAKLVSINLPAGTPGEQAAFLIVNVERINAINVAPESEREAMSAIVQAIPLASEMLQEKPGSKLMVILTDGKQVDGDTGLNFERTVPTTEEFIKAVDDAGQVPNLTGIIVVMAGLGAHRSPKSSTDERVAQCWEGYFQHFGAESSVIYRGSFHENSQ